jgi:hypothetical protein
MTMKTCEDMVDTIRERGEGLKEDLGRDLQCIPIFPLNLTYCTSSSSLLVQII